MSAVIRVGDAWVVREHVVAVTPGQYPSSHPRILLTGGHTVTVEGTVEDIVRALFGHDDADAPSRAAIRAQLEHAAAERAARRAAQLAQMAGTDRTAITYTEPESDPS